MKISSKPFGSLPSGKQAFLYRLENNNGIVAEVTNYGCTVISLCIPDRNGVEADIVTGYRTFDEWIKNPAYFGCLVGRTCNRIDGAKFSIDGIEYKVTANDGEIQLHGGFSGFQNKIWDASVIEKDDRVGLSMEYISPDGEEGFPGNVIVKVIYSLNNKNEFSMEFHAESDKATPINLTNHTYFNLAGENSGTIYSQELLILADKITETNSKGIPTGNFIHVKDTPFDFSYAHAIGDHIHELPMGYDDNFVLRNQTGELAKAVIAYDPISGRVMEILTSEPGVQLYTSNWFDGSITGKGGSPYRKHNAFALETQHYPDSMNHAGFPNVILRPGEHYQSKTIWKFSTK
jgi:aldose 1-epimerase